MKVVRAIQRAASGADAGLVARACAVRVAQARGLSPLDDPEARLLSASLPDLNYDALGGRLLGEVYQASLSPGARKRTGVHYTPAPVARFLVRRAWRGGALLDPACGAGAFLIAAARVAAEQGFGLEGITGYDSDPIAAGLAVEALALEASLADADQARRFWGARVRVGDALAAAHDPVDALVANPPFFSATGRTELQGLGRKRFGLIYSGRNDISHFFVGLALELLGPQGGLGMVLPAYAFENTFASGLRRQLNGQLPEVEVIDLGTTKLFGAQVHAVLVSARKGRRVGTRRWFVPGGNDPDSVMADLERLTAGEEAQVLRARRPEPVDLLGRLERLPSLGTCAHVEKGCETGRNHIFTMEEGQARSLGLEPEVLRPLLKGRHVSPFRTVPSGRVLLYLDGTIPLEQLPGVRAYLEPFRAELLCRADCRDGLYPWWRLHRPRSRALAAAEVKLAVPYRRAEPAFAVERTGALNDGGDLRFLIPAPGIDPDYLCGILNSRVVRCWLSWRGKRKGPLFELFQEPLKRIPIPVADPTLAGRIAALARSQPAARSREELEALVAEAFDVEPADLTLPDG